MTAELAESFGFSRDSPKVYATSATDFSTTLRHSAFSGSQKQKNKGGLIKVAFALLIVVVKYVGRIDPLYRLSAIPKVKAGMIKL